MPPAGRSGFVSNVVLLRIRRGSNRSMEGIKCLPMEIASENVKKITTQSFVTIPIS
jgi:hypothetical protein